MLFRTLATLRTDIRLFSDVISCVETAQHLLSMRSLLIGQGAYWKATASNSSISEHVRYPIRSSPISRNFAVVDS